MKFSSIAIASALALAAGAAQAGTTFVVPGTSNPFLAGASGLDYVIMNGAEDTASSESAVAVPVTGGETLILSVKIDPKFGPVGNCPGCTSPITGGYDINSSAVKPSGFTPLVTSYPTALPINSLVGLFNGSSPSVFEIGAGGTFVAPAAATTLYLGTVDGYQWSNNVGAYDVTVNSVPEPATWAMMVAGLGMVGATMRMAQRKRILAAAA